MPTDRRRGGWPVTSAWMPGSLADALEQALATARTGSWSAARRATSGPRPMSRPGRATVAGGPGDGRGRGRGTGAPSGRMPDRGVDRPPFPDEVQHARRYASRLRQAITARHAARPTSARPAGASTAAPTRAAARSAPAGRPVSTHPWRVIRQVRAPIEEPHVGLIIDTSGSMGALRVRARPDRLDPHRRRCARSAAGWPPRCSATAPRCSPTAPPDCAQVPGIRTGGGTAFAGDAIELRVDRLEMANPRRPRFVYVPLRRRLVMTRRPASRGSASCAPTACRPSIWRSAAHRCRWRPTAWW